MVVLPERALVLKQSSILKLNVHVNELAELLAFDSPYAETNEIVVYGPYFDFESLEEVCARLRNCGLEYWDDFMDIKEDTPEWITLYVGGYRAK
ncbi:hypothetical protein [Roseovarius rhodophyticola]|uniref:Uncharacterized protein n=1 Tax=Roseovarius rhodophyticola TaxID=3080827 RepID=A0ABZ2THE6_9RHOB|nr:hypothetical protein [Roseovarius sp. W115]MDV2929439.1 hypothetical protein [Roseovarius sp. W115]